MPTKAVIPAAGLGTRFLPLTKSIPKEMLPLVDKPTIQYVVQEAADSGIKDILIVTARGKEAIEEHFQAAPALEQQLAAANKNHLYAELKTLLEKTNITFCHQENPNGLGDAIAYAQDFAGSDPVAVLLGDTVINADTPATAQLLETYNEYQSTVIGIERVPRDKVSRYGIIAGEPLTPQVHRVRGMVEKPPVATSPSDLAVASRYILTPDIFPILARTPRGKNNEIQITDALNLLLSQAEIYAHHISGKRYDLGNKQDYLLAQIEFGLLRAEYQEEIRNYLARITPI